MSAIQVQEGVAEPEYVDQGLPYDSSILAVDTVSPIAYVDQGLPFTASQRICVTTLTPVRWDEDARPFGPDNRIAVSDAAVDHYTNETPYTATGAWAVVSITPNPGVTIIDQPDSISVVEPTGAAFDVTAVSGDGSPLTYQWQVFDGGWTDIPEAPPYSGTQTDTLTIDPTELADSGGQYRVEVCNDINCVFSDVVTLTVTAVETFYILAENGDFVITENLGDNMVSEQAA